MKTISESYIRRSIKCGNYNFAGTKIENVEMSQFLNCATKSFNFSHCVFEHVNFAHSIAHDISLHHSQLNDCNFKFAYMNLIEASYAEFSGCNFTASEIKKINTGHTKFDYCIFTRCRGDEWHFHRADMEHCDLSHAHIKIIDFKKALINDCKFYGLKFDKIHNRQIDWHSFATNQFMQVVDDKVTIQLSDDDTFMFSVGDLGSPHIEPVIRPYRSEQFDKWLEYVAEKYITNN